MNIEQPQFHPEKKSNNFFKQITHKTKNIYIHMYYGISIYSEITMENRM